MMPRDDISFEDANRLIRYDPASGLFYRRIGTGKGAKKGAICGTITSNGYVSISLRQKRHMAHRLAFLLMTGDFPDGFVDHINMCKSDNRWLNLRVCNKVLNAGNAKAHKDSITGVKGVSPWNGKYKATIGVNGGQVTIGYFSDIDTARKAYERYALDHFGEFARSE
jgi:hypothetical protein